MHLDDRRMAAIATVTSITRHLDDFDYDCRPTDRLTDLLLLLLPAAHRNAYIVHKTKRRGAKNLAIIADVAKTTFSHRLLKANDLKETGIATDKLLELEITAQLNYLHLFHEGPLAI
eukprot:GHVU01164436.1.p2 GENE.GHVU01164436.1~~GHVU01164436.1.p2  ORF type:complete len:117 (+),score=22.38 GHVU01164436.1:195-545(+)